MREKIARGAALLLALLLAGGYFFLPAVRETSSPGTGGLVKEEIPTDGELTCAWTPALKQVNALTLTLSGKKKAEGMTVTVSVRDGNGKEIASVSQAVAEMGDSDGITLEGTFAGDTAYVLALRAEGEGSIKVKGGSGEDGSFLPTVRETGRETVHNPVLLYFAAGLLLTAAAPVTGGEKSRELRRISEKKTTVGWLLPLATFILIACFGITVGLIKDVYEVGGRWAGWDEEIHLFSVQQLLPRYTAALPERLAAVTAAAPGYIPLTLGARAAGWFTADGGVMYRAGVICNALVYAALAALAVRHAPRYKATFLAAATLPTFLFVMTCMSYDAVAVGTILLGLALALEAMDQERKVSAFQAITMVSVLAFGNTIKVLYSPVMLFLLLIPDERFESRKKAWAFRGFVLVMFVWCVCAAFLAGDSVWQGDERLSEASTPGQFAYILANPVEGLLKPIRPLWENLSFTVKDGISHWAYMGNNAVLNNVYLWLLLAAAPLCTAGETWKRGSLMTPVRRIFLLVIAVGCECLFAYALYLTSSPVGGELVGMQARYFMPLWITAALALMWPHTIRKRLGRMGDWMTVLVFLTCAGGNVINLLGHLRALNVP